MRRHTVVLMNIVLALVLIGLVMAYSAGIGRPQSEAGAPDPFVFLRDHVKFAAIGLGLMFIAARVDYHVWKLRPVLWALAGAALLALVLVLAVGVEIRGAQRWLDIFGVRFQPSEYAKLVLVILLAVKLSENQQETPKFWRGFVPPLLITGAFAGLVLAEHDLGTPVIMGFVATTMIFMAGGKLWHIALAGAPACAGVYFLIASDKERTDRIAAFLDPWENRSDGALQLIESLAGFARGGIWGRGLGAGEQKLYYLPDAHSDFIFSVWGEEMGLVGTLAMVILFAGLVILAVRIAICAPDLYGSMLAVGIASLIGVQAAANMGVTTGLLPTKGLGLPFISAGGSSLIMNLMLAGILLNVGIQGVEREKPATMAPALRRA